jgi:CubicO group peptidase (beta-lactamase class C family)
VNDGWETATLSSVGLNQAPIEEMVWRVGVGAYQEVHSVVIVKNNKLVFEEYWAGHDFSISSSDYHGRYVQFDRSTRHNTHSATKSITSALVGIALAKAFIDTVAENIFRYLPNHQMLRSGGRENITIEHALTMSSGLQWNEWGVSVSSPEHDVVQFNQSSDPIRYLLSKPLVATPGTSFCYNGANVDLLGVIIANASEQSVQSFSSQYLFNPLGISNYNWQVLQPSGLTCCHGDIYITPRDMAKFGQLFLNEGSWNGVQIVPKKWVEQSTQYRINPMVSWADGYGYLWWLRNLRVNNTWVSSFKAIGWGGQEIFVFKDLAMVIVFTGANYMSNVPCDEIMQRFILPSAGM